MSDPGSYLTLAEFTSRTLMPSVEVAALESSEPGWLYLQLKIKTAELNDRLRKRYAVPFAAPVPEKVRDWLTRVVTLRAYLKRGFNPSDEQSAVIVQDAEKAEAELKEAADPTNNLWELPVAQDNQDSGATRPQTLAYSEQSPYTWKHRQADAVRGNRRYG